GPFLVRLLLAFRRPEAAAYGTVRTSVAPHRGRPPRAPALGLRVSCHPCGLVSDAKTAVAALPFCRGHSRNSCRPGALAGLPPERSRFFGDSRFGSRACAALNPGGRPAALPSAEQPWLQHRRPAAYAAGFHAGPDEPHSVSLRRPALLLLLRG